jgi:LuxR family maltose regulon positive regulatory protein
MATRLDVGADGLPPLFGTALTLTEAELRLALDQVREAARLLAGIAAAGPLPEWTAIVRAKLHLATGEASAAAAAVGRYATARSGTSARSAEACLLHARALHSLGNRQAGVRLVERSLRLANAEGLRHPFLVNAALVRDLLLAQLAAGSGYADLITDVTGVTTDEPEADEAVTDGPTAAPRARPSGVEPLTERELVVLRHLRTMLSTPEIASMLCVSANTVKTHVKNVYRKLGVGRRRDAIRRAQEVGLI